MNVGLIGCGRVAGVHMAVYKRIKDVNVVAVSDLNLEKAKTFAKEHGVEKFFEDYVDLLELRELDFVDICTPVSTHAHIACDIAKFGLDILTEKPMALSTAECEKMIAESKKQGVRLCVCHNQLFIPSLMKAKSLVDSGYYNLVSFKTSCKESFEVLQARKFAQKWNISPEEKGILWEVACHPAYLQLHFLQDIKEVFALGNKVKYPVYDEFTVLLRTPGQPYGIMDVSWLTKEAEMVYEISDSEGRILQIYRDHDYLLEKSEIPPSNVMEAAHSIYLDEKRLLKKWMKFGLTYLNRGKLHPTEFPHFILISRYIESLKNDSTVPVTPDEGKKTIKLLECIEESLNNHTVVHMK